MASRYWVVSLPVQNSATSLWSRLQESVSKQSFDTPLYRFNVPDLRVGTLDSLLALCDDLVKSNNFIEGVSNKIRRQIEEFERVSGVESSALSVDGVPVDSYLTRFQWDEAKYPTMSPLKEIVDNIHVQVAKIEDDLKVRVAEYNTIRSQLNTINRKQGGSLAVRDLSNIVKPEDIVTSEHLVTLLAVVPKYSQKDWLSSYETLTTYVVSVRWTEEELRVGRKLDVGDLDWSEVPRSSKKLYEDNEYALYTVTLFGRVADNFRTSAREKGFQIRDFEYSPEAQESRKQELERLLRDQESLRSSLLQWCYTCYGEVCLFLQVFTIFWLHLDLCREHFKIRLATFIFGTQAFQYTSTFYDISVSNTYRGVWFQAVVLAPSVKSEKKVRSILEGVCDSRNSNFWSSEEEVGAMAGLGGDTDTHPYVSFTINLT
ncbi:hypothetical protein IFM89_029029 [Coptis chinensis]|uniref:V-type proton ATPase subunit C n=1 Tax=Coptis chinensis TaxID=261450 RepID=A0A835M1K0_9MAGN|nr:hypothetical protein IFM89_029029 [Coptis chinensis]